MTASFTFGCAICTEGFDIHKKVCATRCGHVYHDTCLHRWMMSQSTRGYHPTTCPKCRASVSNHQVLRLFLHQVDVSSERGSGSEHDSHSENEAESDDDSIHSYAGPEFEFSDDDTWSADSMTEEEEERTVNDITSPFMDEVRQLRFGRNMDLLSALDQRLDEALNEINAMDNTVDHFLDAFNTDM